MGKWWKHYLVLAGFIDNETFKPVVEKEEKGYFRINSQHEALNQEYIWYILKLQVVNIESSCLKCGLCSPVELFMPILFGRLYIGLPPYLSSLSIYLPTSLPNYSFIHWVDDMDMLIFFLLKSSWVMTVQLSWLLCFWKKIVSFFCIFNSLW